MRYSVCHSKSCIVLKHSQSIMNHIFILSFFKGFWNKIQFMSLQTFRYLCTFSFRKFKTRVINRHRLVALFPDFGLADNRTSSRKVYALRGSYMWMHCIPGINQCIPGPGNWPISAILTTDQSVYPVNWPISVSRELTNQCIPGNCQLVHPRELTN